MLASRPGCGWWRTVRAASADCPGASPAWKDHVGRVGFVKKPTTPCRCSTRCGCSALARRHPVQCRRESPNASSATIEVGHPPSCGRSGQKSPDQERHRFPAALGGRPDLGGSMAASGHGVTIVRIDADGRCRGVELNRLSSGVRRSSNRDRGVTSGTTSAGGRSGTG